MLSRKIAVKTQFEFIHCWPEAPEEVSFLRVPHRHMLHVKCIIEVYHDDRELEFIMVKRYLEDLLVAHVFELRTSCEQVAEFIIQNVVARYGQRCITVEVFEDDENGAIVESKPFTEELL